MNTDKIKTAEDCPGSDAFYAKAYAKMMCRNGGVESFKLGKLGKPGKSDIDITKIGPVGKPGRGNKVEMRKGDKCPHSATCDGLGGKEYNGFRNCKHTNHNHTKKKVSIAAVNHFAFDKDFAAQFDPVKVGPSKTSTVVTRTCIARATVIPQNVPQNNSTIIPTVAPASSTPSSSTAATDIIPVETPVSITPLEPHPADDYEKTNCQICFENKADSLLYPCTDSICSGCAIGCRGEKFEFTCPLCTRAVTMVIPLEKRNFL